MQKSIRSLEALPSIAPLAAQAGEAPASSNTRNLSRNLDFCTKNEQLEQEIEPHIFVDWLTISQTYKQALPVISGGLVQSFDKDGILEYQTNKRFLLEGSFDSRIALNCDGSTVTLSGNLSRFLRRDNVFGHDIDTCLQNANQILASFGLPNFSAGDVYFNQDGKLVWSGAKISRIDLTCNYATGSQSDAQTFLRWLSTQNADHHKTNTYGENTTVDFGRGSKHIYAKAYNKFIQLLKHKNSHVSQEILNWVEQSGIVRFEVTAKSSFLRKSGYQYLGVLTMQNLQKIYDEKAKVLFRAECGKTDIDSLPKRLRLAYADYMAGRSFEGSRSSFYSIRKELLPFGIDISAKRNVHVMPTRVHVIKLQPAAAPEWYWEESVRQAA